MDFFRNIYSELLEWKSSKSRKPLVLLGARQVGKTHVLREFGKTYKNFYYLNLELEKEREHAKIHKQIEKNGRKRDEERERMRERVKQKKRMVENGRKK